MRVPDILKNLRPLTVTGAQLGTFGKTVVSSSSDEQRHNRKDAERDEVCRSGHRVPASEILANCQTLEPEHEREFRAK